METAVNVGMSVSLLKRAINCAPNEQRAAVFVNSLNQSKNQQLHELPGLNEQNRHDDDVIRVKFA